MAKIVLIGWYGSETIGDRAILAGLLNLFSEVFDAFEIKIGSFLEALTERTLLEDLNFYTEISSTKMKMISIFNSSRVSELNAQIDWADIVAVGGGPLAEIDQMYMLEYALCRSRKKHKRTALLGCGVGPLVSQPMISSFYSIVKNADLKIFRDNNLSLMKKGQNEKYYMSCDPAVFAAKYFLEKNKNSKRTENLISVNFREIVSGVEMNRDEKRNLFISLLHDLIQKTTSEIMLIPMHTFYIGGDDRNTLNWIADRLKSERIKVQNEPLNLEETMSVYYHSCCSIGMRFHSILLQTLLNGKNYILDYTLPSMGKTSNFLDLFDLSDKYIERYMSLITNDKSNLDINPDCSRVLIPEHLLSDMHFTYIKALKSLL